MTTQDEELKDYITNSLRSGHSEYEIRNTLSQTNWSSDSIDAAFAALESVSDDQNIMPPSTPIPQKPASKKRIIFISIIALIILAIAGVIIYFLTTTDRDSSQSFADYKQPALLPGWKEGTLAYDNKTFSFAYPNDWRVINHYSDPTGASADLRIVSPDYEAIDSTDDFSIKGTVKTGALIDIQVGKYKGSLESYESKIKDKSIGLLAIDGYMDLKRLELGERTAIDYLAVTNFTRKAVIVDGLYFAQISYAQPYATSDPKKKPNLEDLHIDKFKAVIASIGY